MTEQTNAWITGYVGEFKVSFTITPDATSETLDTLWDAVAYIANKGLKANYEGVDASAEVIEATSGVFYRTAKDDAWVVDFYHDRSKYRAGNLYLNTDEEVKAFENASGLVFASVKKVDNEAVPKRNGDVRPLKSEVRFARPVRVAKKKTGEGEDGKPRYRCELIKGAPMPSQHTPEPAPAFERDIESERATPASALADTSSHARPYFERVRAHYANIITTDNIARYTNGKRLSEMNGTLYTIIEDLLAD